MGNQQSKDQQASESQAIDIPLDPLISRLRSTFRLATQAPEAANTNSFIHIFFSQQITQADTGNLNPSFSPFCSIFIRDPKESKLISCPLVSPIAAIAPSNHICDSSGFVFQTNMVVEGVIKGDKIERRVKKTMVFKDKTIVLLFLEQPIWQLGWCGVMFITEKTKINELALYKIQITVSEPLEGRPNSQKPRLAQKIERVFASSHGQFKGKSVKSSYGLIFQIIERKAYITGIQIDKIIHFFDMEAYEDLQYMSTSYLTPHIEKNYLKNIDLEQLQIQTNW